MTQTAAALKDRFNRLAVYLCKYLIIMYAYTLHSDNPRVFIVSISNGAGLGD
jgi:hypothetical protein